QHSPIECGGCSGEMVVTHPPGSEGNRDSQNNRCKLAHIVEPLTAVHACNYPIIPPPDAPHRFTTLPPEPPPRAAASGCIRDTGNACVRTAFEIPSYCQKLCFEEFSSGS